VFESFFSKSNPSDTEQERLRMVQEQLRGRGIRDERVLAAMAKVPREEFAESENPREAYGDHPLPIGAGQTVSQPYMVAAMVQVLNVQPQDRVLEVGTGTGYEAAVLGELAGEVWSIERFPELAQKAEQNLARLGYRNVHVVVGDGSVGLPEHAPYDKIVVAAAAPNVPQALVAQLAEGGSLVIPIGTRTDQQIQVIRKVAGEVVTTHAELCRFVPLVGEAGWKE
jgi:protein-L-isoaspartate(D-aspartate) O-methyltransferase